MIIWWVASLWHSVTSLWKLPTLPQVHFFFCRKIYKNVAEIKGRVTRFTYHSKWLEPRSISSSYCVIVWVRVVLKRTVVGDWRSTTWVEVIFGLKWIVFVSRWCYKVGPLNVIGQFSHDGIGWKTCVKFVISYWYWLVSICLFGSKIGLFLVCLLLVKLGWSVI